MCGIVGIVGNGRRAAAPLLLDALRRLEYRGYDSAGIATLVAAFATHPGRALSREDLLRLAPARDGETYDRSIDNRITRLRRKLERDPAKPELIKTVRGAGYIHPG